MSELGPLPGAAGRWPVAGKHSQGFPPCDQIGICPCDPSFPWWLKHGCEDENGFVLQAAAGKLALSRV